MFFTHSLFDFLTYSLSGRLFQFWWICTHLKSPVAEQTNEQPNARYAVPLSDIPPPMPVPPVSSARFASPAPDPSDQSDNGVVLKPEECMSVWDSRVSICI